MQSKICQISCRNMEEEESKRFLGALIYLRFSVVDTFFSENKASFIKDAF